MWGLSVSTDPLNRPIPLSDHERRALLALRFLARLDSARQHDHRPAAPVALTDGLAAPHGETVAQVLRDGHQVLDAIHQRRLAQIGRAHV